MSNSDPSEPIGTANLRHEPHDKLGFWRSSFQGRIDRRSYWIGIIYLVGLQFITVAAASAYMIQTSGLDARSTAWIAFGVQLLYLYPVSALLIKRLHDRGHPAYFVAFAIVPALLMTSMDILASDSKASDMAIELFGVIVRILLLFVGIWFFIELGCLRGTIGPNKYGSDPLSHETTEADRG
jgi:uncharacterized membrane protein YhaH (DUF805 family)